jgi:DNA-directed RNA polymerase subunit M/transcription elongation factor TFIIS
MEITGKVNSNEKRLQMPGTFVTMKCPKCGEEYELEMVDHIMYPGADEPHCFYGECEKCEDYWQVPYTVEVFAKITI